MCANYLKGHWILTLGAFVFIFWFQTTVHNFVRIAGAGYASVCRLSVCHSSVTLIHCDHISWATWNFITQLISPVSQLSARVSLMIECKGNILKFGVVVGKIGYFQPISRDISEMVRDRAKVLSGCVRFIWIFMRVL